MPTLKQKLEQSQISNLTMQLKTLGKQEQTKLQINSWKNISDWQTPNQIKQTRENMQVNRIRDEKRDISINTKEIKKIMMA